LGFLNTLFYNNINIFRDVTSGNNACPLSTGYSARAGWDACTGWGSIVGTSLYQLLHVGTTYPKQNYGFRPSTGSAYPRKTTGAR
jgi:kumamolisin